MKQVYPLQLVISKAVSFLICLLLFVLEVKAQQPLIANAGPDTSVCLESDRVIGGNPTAQGGVPPYTYRWSIYGVSYRLNDPNIANPVVIPGNTFDGNQLFFPAIVIVTDSLGNIATDTAILTQNLSLVLGEMPTIEVCYPDCVNMDARPYIYGAVPPCIYQWSPTTSLNSDTIPNPTSCGLVFPTQFNLSVGDATGCFVSTELSGSYSIAMDSCFTLVTTNVSCNGGSDGTAQIFFRGGAIPDSLYAIGFEDSIGDFYDTSFLNNLSAGNYLWYSPIYSYNFTINQPAPINVAPTVLNSSNCSNDCNGFIRTQVSGGTPPYSTILYMGHGWDTEYIGTGTQFAGLCPSGLFNMYVDDANGCTFYPDDFIVNCDTGCHIQALTYNTNFDCSHLIDTTILTIENGTPPSNISWGDGSSTVSYSSIQQHVYLNPGIYFIITDDSLDCGKYFNDTVRSFATMRLDTALLIQPTCSKAGNGFIEVGVHGGETPYTFSWNNGGNSDSIGALVEGAYSVTVTDQRGCNAQHTFNLVQTVNDWSYYVFLTGEEANCDTNGSVGSTVNGGTSPFTYLWSNGQTGATLVNVGKGNYELTITDAAGCERTGNYLVDSICSNRITGTVFNDLNKNCQVDSGEKGIAGITVVATQGGQRYYGYTDDFGNYSIVANEGIYNLAAYYNGALACATIAFCDTNPQVVFTSYAGDTSAGNDFGAQASGDDLVVHPGWTSAEPGFQKKYWIYYYNQSVIPFTNTAIVTFVFDSNLVYQNSDPPQPVYNHIAHSLTWSVNNVTDGTSATLQTSKVGNSYFLVPANLPLGYQLQSFFSITPITGDCDTANNFLSLMNVITGSRDPNGKEVTPADSIPDNTSALTYTIHFQNTGTDTTNFIIIRDTLSPYLDPTTLENVASSQPYSSFTIAGQGILTWVFNPIFLVDSATNPDGSKGFIVYRVNKRSNAPIGAQISNNASIYFDYNNAVFTNTVSNSIVCHNYSSSFVAAICDGENYSFNDSTFTSGGDYDFSFQTIHGCDSLVSLHLDILPHYTLNQQATICQGEYYTFKNTQLNISGNYIDSFTSVNGCDSLIVLQLSVDSINAQIEQLSGDSLLVSGNGAVQWMNCNTGRIIVGETDNLFTTGSFGSYAAVLTNGNCIDTTQCLELGYTSLSQNQAYNDIKILPNPAIDQLFILVSGIVPDVVTIYDLNGRNVLETKFNTTLNISLLTSGLYFIEFEKSGVVERNKFVKL